MSKLVHCTACTHPVAYDAAICPRCGRECPAPVLWQLVAAVKNFVVAIVGFVTLIGGIAFAAAVYRLVAA